MMRKIVCAFPVLNSRVFLISRVSLLICVLAAMPIATNASTVVFDSVGGRSNSTYVVGTTNPPSLNPARHAMPFIPSGTGFVSELEFQLTTFVLGGNALEAVLYTHAEVVGSPFGQPGTILESVPVIAALQSGDMLLSVEFGGSTRIESGSMYWLGLTPLVGDMFVGWQHNTLGLPGPRAFTFPSVLPAWIVDPLEIAQFRVSVNIIPIPAAVWLFGSALGLLGWMRCKR